MSDRGRLLDDPPLAGLENMGRDLALLELQRVPTLRFYRWAQPTLSLGWFQDAADLPVEAVLARGGEVVRRPSGGKAILHENELTYSLCAPERGALAGGPARAMRRLHECLGAELGRQAGSTVTVRASNALDSDVADSAWCFLDSSALDLCLDSRKLLGSAARRRSGWILFHGSLVLEAPRETPEVAALGFEPDRAAIANALGDALGIQFAAGEWDASELALASELPSRFHLDPTVAR